MTNKENFDLQQHIADGVEKIVSDALKATFKDPKESAFLVKFAAAAKKASRIRLKSEEKGEHTPGFLICSVTSSCNLHCAGCYSRCINTTTDGVPEGQLSGEEWLRIFREAQELGISFILVAGGEPLLRRDIIEGAGSVSNIIFPIFTNGTYIDEAYLKLFDRCRNLIPVMSIEGGKETTDQRRGPGMYEVITGNMEEFQKRGLLFGASITVTTENIREVTSPDYVDLLLRKGCRMILYIEFVPVTEEAQYLAPGDPERRYMEDAMDRLRRDNDGTIFLSFPGDELAMGGCMAAGREFFHINSHGGAEPCPFSPFSDINVKNTSLRQALNSDLFQKIRSEGLLLDDHKGGCVLYEKRDLVQALLGQSEV